MSDVFATGKASRLGDHATFTGTRGISKQVGKGALTIGRDMILSGGCRTIDEGPVMHVHKFGEGNFSFTVSCFIYLPFEHAHPYSFPRGVKYFARVFR